MGREAVIRQCPPRAVLGIGRSAPIAAERAASLVARLLNGAMPVALPVEPLMACALVINRHTA
jgi:hypothetical protein